MLSLNIHHNIHLDHNERKRLHEGEDINTVGVCVPVWAENGKTNEPAREYFCKYYLKNPKVDIPISILHDGFEINLPHRPGGTLQISDDDWRHLFSSSPDKMEMLYRQVVVEASSLNLLDIHEGGSQFLFYREHNKVEQEGEIINIIHYVQFSSKEQLERQLSAS